ncbi:MAG: hypothetical protein QOH94_2168, partial [Mycobacterium sp.]|nr:hypothetical protein [Mycobacterium sp.]
TILACTALAAALASLALVDELED